MNRKLFFGLLVSACMLFATSCKKDELDESLYGGETKVTFSLGLEGENVATKAISNGEKADKLIYAVFDENGTRISSIAAVQVTDVTFPKEVTLTLAKGQTYQVAFWAQDNDCQAYTVDTETMNVTVSYDNALNNDETRDAFFAAETFTVDGDQEIGVTMRRPFAQINVGATVADWNAAVASGVVISTSKVVINNAATSINLLTGAVADPVEVVYDFATIPAQFDPVENLMVDTDGDGTPEIYKWLSMSYILVNDENGGSSKATLESEGLQFTFHPESGNDIMFFEGLNNVPVQRNWRTNILGQLLTDNITFNISIEPIYYGEYNNTDDFEGKNISLNGIYYETLEEAITAAQPGETIYVGTGEYTFPEITKNITIICEEGTKFNITEPVNALDIAESTIIGASFINNASKAELVARGLVKGVFRNCHFEGYPNALRMCIATTKTEFENCTFVGEVYPFHFDEGSGDGNKIICNDCVFEGKSIEIGASVKMFEATNCDFNIEELVYMWGKAKYENCEFDKPSDKVGNMDYATYTNCTYDGRALTANDIYIDNTIIKVNGEHYSQASTAEQLTNAISNATQEYSPMKVLVKNDIEGNVEAHQQSGVDVIVDGQEHKYDGAIFIYGHANNNGKEILEFNNIKFETDKTPSQDWPGNEGVGYHYFIWSNSTDPEYRYAHNVTIKNCSFTATGNAAGVTGGLKFRQAYNLKIENCTSENLYYFVWAESCPQGITIDNVTAENCYEGGISLGQSNGLVVENTTVTTTGDAYAYGIRAKANENNYSLNVKNVNLSADVPILLRNATAANYTLALSGNNTLTKGGDYHIIVTAAGNYNASNPLTTPTGNITITGAEGFDVWDGNE